MQSLEWHLDEMVEAETAAWELNIQETTHHDEIDEIVRLSGFAKRMKWKADGRAEWMWCGMFAAANAFKAGLAKALRPGLWHVDNVVDFFNYVYGKRVPGYAVVDNKKVDLKQFHESCRATRRWISHEELDAMVIQKGPHGLAFCEGIPVCKGCILLEDREGDGTPNHITTVESYSGEGLITTLEGNASGVMASGKVARRDSVTKKYRDLRDPAERKKIHGIGIFSLMDFEHGQY